MASDILEMHFLWWVRELKMPVAACVWVGKAKAHYSLMLQSVCVGGIALLEIQGQIGSSSVSLPDEKQLVLNPLKWHF